MELNKNFVIIKDEKDNIISTRAEYSAANIDIGSLDRESFSFLGHWIECLGKDGYGFFYRIGSKSVNSLNRMAPEKAFILFYNYAVKKDKELTNGIANSISGNVRKITEEFSALYSKNNHGKRAAFIIHKTPEWMVSELEEMLEKRH